MLQTALLIGETSDAAGDFGFATGKIGGYIGVLTGIDALLVAFIETLNATANRVVIPLGVPFVSN